MRPLLLVALCYARLLAADAPPPPISIVPAVLREDGSLTWVADRPSGAPTTLTLTLAVRIAGPGAVIALGAPRLVSLTVDDGRAVPIVDDDSQTFPWRDAGIGWPRGAQRPSPRAQLRLPPGVHGAKRIARLAGRLPCTWADARKRVALAPLATHLGKRIRVAGVDGDPVVQIERAGDQVTLVATEAAMRAIAAVEFVGADDGSVVANLSGSNNQTGERRWTWTLANPPDDVAMRIEWWTGMHRDDVAFSVNDLVLAGDTGKTADDF